VVLSAVMKIEIMGRGVTTLNRPWCSLRLIPAGSGVAAPDDAGAQIKPYLDAGLNHLRGRFRGGDELTGCLWALMGVALVLWAGSWRVMYLEVTRWHHMDSRLRFIAPSTLPGGPVPRAGLPVRLARLAAIVAPPTALASASLLRRLAPAGRPRAAGRSFAVTAPRRAAIPPAPQA
jgi:hypothetical protein